MKEAALASTQGLAQHASALSCKQQVAHLPGSTSPGLSPESEVKKAAWSWFEDTMGRQMSVQL